MNKTGDLILPHGGYQKLRSFKVALASYDGTAIFCNRFIDRRSRTHDQMVQAARSGVQNIAEGSLASGTSKKTELKLTNVARASLEELIRDYEDYLRQNDLAAWDKESPRVRGMRARLAGKPAPGIGGRGHDTHASYAKSDSSAKSDGSEGSEGSEGAIDWAEIRSRPPVFDEPLLAALNALKSASPEASANILLCLTHQASYLLRRQLERLESDFVQNGGFTERLYRYRKDHRDGGKS